MMRRSLAAMIAAATWAMLAATTPAHAQLTLGRLFATPAERAAMEATRGASAALAPNSQGEQPAAGAPGGPAAFTPPMSASQMIGAPMAPPPMGPPPMNAAPMPGAANMAASADGTPPPTAAVAPPMLTMSGILRRSGDNHTTVWLNNQPQYRAQGKLSQRGGAATPNLTVTLPSGKKVTLKPGQRYDLNEGRVKDVNEP